MVSKILSLRQWREVRALSQRDLARLAGVNQVTIARLEKGRVRRPSFAVRQRIAQALGVRPEEIAEFRRAMGLPEESLSGPLTLIHFAHPLTEEQLRQIEALAGRKVERVIAVDAQIDPARPLASQVAEMADRAGLSPQEWQTLPLLILLPSLNDLAGVLLAELHGRMGYFPSIVRMRPVPEAVPPRFEAVEIIYLQAVRDAARAGRSRA